MSTSGTTRRILIVEDHPVVREGYARMFKDEPGLTICQQTGSATEARDLFRETDPDLGIIDLSLKDGSGLELIKDLRATRPEVKILVVSIHDEVLYAERALQAGARGYLMKEEAGLQILEAVEEILNGGVYLNPDLSNELLLKYTRSDQEGAVSPLDPLSDRELEVFQLMGKGLTRNEIGDTLSLSPKTIDSHRGCIKDKLSIKSNAELRRRATIWLELGIWSENLEDSFLNEEGAAEL